MAKMVLPPLENLVDVLTWNTAIACLCHLPAHVNWCLVSFPSVVYTSHYFVLQILKYIFIVLQFILKSYFSPNDLGATDKLTTIAE